MIHGSPGRGQVIWLDTLRAIIAIGEGMLYIRYGRVMIAQEPIGIEHAHEADCVLNEPYTEPAPHPIPKDWMVDGCSEEGGENEAEWEDGVGGEDEKSGRDENDGDEVEGHEVDENDDGGVAADEGSEDGHHDGCEEVVDDDGEHVDASTIVVRV